MSASAEAGRNARLLAGVDEAGRGPLAGPVVAAAVVLHPERLLTGLKDSKTLSAARREALARDIRASAIGWAVAWSDPAEIDAINILWASMLAMRRALLGLHLYPGFVEVDGNRLPDLKLGATKIPGTAIVGGDRTRHAISAASILAKVTRDEIMRRADLRYPEYGFARHKGYGTLEHRQQLERHGPCPLHRQSFRPVADVADLAGRGTGRPSVRGR